ncbi:hypothetical protein Mia14_0690 [Candidatus Mancarchaeum acidiphilum]|uniref:Uncharacterized protein n=1 Tax=Candidatus Mancarchaeum acidiphilum TaxID=1920749 RepID=A0A218NNE8_9ARCH|nr:hypothetical protein [Candidatus Mancarchaeum acidiphilum]ASI13990.1 hypothetical protein Mia14_0690 [Candidatus Mancarchaeum acidiphilum]
MVKNDTQEYGLNIESPIRNEIKGRVLTALRKVDFEKILNSTMPYRKPVDKSAGIALSELLAEQAVDYIIKAIEISKDKNMERVGPAALIIAADEIRNSK